MALLLAAFLFFEELSVTAGTLSAAALAAAAEAAALTAAVLCETWRSALGQNLPPSP